MSSPFLIVVVGYNRIDSLKALLASLVSAEYEEDKVDLVISVDKSGIQEDILRSLDDFVWPYGECSIRAFSEKQGLRKHILSCGDLTDNYDAVAVFEDDIIVSTQYYKYLKYTLKAYCDCPEIAGISLYSYAINEFCGEPFIPSYNGYDTFLMQVAQSWGQCWTKKMWRGFRDWIDNDKEELEIDSYMPQVVFEWGKSSWKKNYMAYIVKNNLFFVYPYHSYTTNCSLAGEHRREDTTNYQVPLAENINSISCAPVNKAIKYDVFFERIGVTISNHFMPDCKIGIDFYGLRKDYSEFDILISRQLLPYKVLRTIGLRFKPYERNIEALLEGNGLYVYDLSISAEPPKNSDNKYLLYEYNHSSTGLALLIQYIIYKVKRKLIKLIEHR